VENYLPLGRTWSVIGFDAMARTVCSSKSAGAPRKDSNVETPESVRSVEAQVAGLSILRLRSGRVFTNIDLKFFRKLLLVSLIFVVATI
jgi:hypothetical protein